MKRFFDVAFSLLGTIFFAPIAVLVLFAIKIDSKGPVLFTQERVGMREKKFRILKFRTMYINAEKARKITVGSRDSRVTRVGYYLRKFKIDEVPQLINVLKGEMSFVGPRPEVQEYIELYPIHIRKRVLSVRPGITDNASLQLFNENDLLEKYDDPELAYVEIILPLKQRLYLDYVENQSLTKDALIVIKTILKVVGLRLGDK